MLKQLCIWGSLFILMILLMGSFRLPTLETLPFTNNFMNNSGVIKTFLSVLILFLVAYILMVGVILKKYSLKIEQLNFGGINVLFNNSDILFRQSIKNYLDAKRTLFKISAELDSFDETLSSYYEIHNFIRTEMKVLNLKRRKDRHLYELSNEALKELNDFLTKYQNNYRRWHKYVSEKDAVLTKEKDSYGNRVSLPYHLTPIGKLQTHYYHYSKMLNGFIGVNKFFNEKFVREFKINTSKWS
ncbi:MULTISPECIES: hypothetical protein [Serratia]|uniref:hypothetical protein n=1 Tax=Serratia TaxID=613 RepID=UPI000744EEAD|nr:hypothetical protein [Serratia marcescens]CUY05471.1 Uncharacterised protein [Serratia marcescens]CUY65516.1 Uncharacterised protein [Serratia marcescens]CUY68842.1 Uncharacterised protein [Serratia marcescens]CUZ00049.1 Uncharacterised protein [Serratia marcescens]CVA47508.1 Uncharacterised protein [Serratia marcescens]